MSKLAWHPIWNRIWSTRFKALEQSFQRNYWDGPIIRWWGIPSGRGRRVHTSFLPQLLSWSKCLSYVLFRDPIFFPAAFVQYELFLGSSELQVQLGHVVKWISGCLRLWGRKNDATSAWTSGASTRPDVPRDHPIEIIGVLKISSNKATTEIKQTYTMQ
jgi:hypothetical protein